MFTPLQYELLSYYSGATDGYVHKGQHSMQGIADAKRQLIKYKLIGMTTTGHTQITEKGNLILHTVQHICESS